MEDSLFPEDMDEFEEEENEEELEEAAEYAQGLGFDTDLIRDGKYSVQTSTGVDSWKQWCINCLCTERVSSPLYSTDFGISTSEAFQAEDRDEAETILASEITEALEADPYERTEQVLEIDFEWDTDSVQVDVLVAGMDGATIDLEVTLGR